MLEFEQVQQVGFFLSLESEVKIMNISEIVIKVIGIILAVVGVCLLLSIIGINIFGIRINSILLSAIFGVLFLGAGIYIIRGGNIRL